MTTDTDLYDTRGVANINGVVYTNSQGAQFCFGSTQRNWKYDLGRRYGSFLTTIGLNDNSNAKAVVRYEIFADERLLYSKDVSLGKSYSVDVSVKDVLRMRLVSTLLTTEGVCGEATAEWGDARLGS